MDEGHRPFGAVAFCVLTLGCVTTTALTRADRLEQQSGECTSFIEFDEQLRLEREGLTQQTPGAELVPASRALSTARRRCARTTVEQLFERQQAAGREVAVAEVQALTRAFGADETLKLLRAKWGAGADVFIADVALAASRPGPTPEQPAPVEPTVRPAAPQMPGPERFGEGQACLRRPTLEAASCLGAWRAEVPDPIQLEVALTELVQQTLDACRSLEVPARATLLGEVLSRVGAPRGTAAIEPLFVALVHTSEVLLREAQRFATTGALERAAVTVRPLRLISETRAAAEVHLRAAARKHEALAENARSLPQAEQLHRQLAAWFIGEARAAPTLEAGAWSNTRWDCIARRPTLPPLPGGFAGRLTARCRNGATQPPATTTDDAMRTFELEASTPRVRIEADVTLSCGPTSTTERLSVEDIVLEQDEAGSTRPHALDEPLRKLVTSTERRCQEQARREFADGCLATLPSLERTQRLVRAGLRLGRAPACFIEWFEREYGVRPPAG